MNSVSCFGIEVRIHLSVRKQESEFSEATERITSCEAASPAHHEDLHASASVPSCDCGAEGDGLHPVLLAGLKRLAAERSEQVAAEASRDEEANRRADRQSRHTRQGG
jgi:hypothetical protein